MNKEFWTLYDTPLTYARTKKAPLEDNILWDSLAAAQAYVDNVDQYAYVICGVVISELYSGIRSKKEEKAIELFVNSIDSLLMEQNDWLQIGNFICNLRKNGLSVPFQDAVIAYLSVKNNCKILTNDKHFSMMKIIDNRIVCV